MSGSSFGGNTKGGTIYSGPSPAAPTGTVYGGPAPGGTVYGGPAPGGTVYSGPAPAGTVYNPTAAAQPGPIAGTAVAQGSAAAARGARIFFLIAGFTGINVVLMFVGIRFAIGLSTTSMNNALALSALGAGIFVTLGIFARNGSKAAFLIGMLLYGGDLALLILNNPGIHILSILIHGLFLFYLFSAFRQLPE